MKYFTDHTVENDWLLVKIKKYISLRDKKPEFLDKKKEVLVDPGVYDLTKSDKFSWEGTINIPEFLDSLPKNHYFSYDYPGDMNVLYKKLFLKKSWINAQKYYHHSQYIVTVQHPIFATIKNKIILDELQFKMWFDKYNNLDIKSGILGLGNMCLGHVNRALKNCLQYAIENCRHKRLHIYGIKLAVVPFIYKLAKRNNIEISVDSTKWTRVVNKELREKMGEGHRSCRGGAERQLFFDEYMKEIRKRGVILE